MKKKVLIITYYWPPSGGAGVQRWVKLSKYLMNNSVEPFILTVDEKFASYATSDTSLFKDISSNLKVFKTKSFEPIKYYSKIVGKENVPTSGFSNVDPGKFGGKLVNFFRSNFFIPDPRKGWNKYALKKAKEIIKSEGIEVVITTSPPHSTQLIGLELQRELKVKWIADLRDPWTDIYYYKLLRHSYFSNLRNQYLERAVLTSADMIITVSDQFKDLFLQKDKAINPDKMHVIPNGFDPADFDGVVKAPHEEFTICYTGTMSGIYKPSVFFHALADVSKTNPGVKVKFQIVGDVSDSIKNEIRDMGLQVEVVPTVPHYQVIKYQVNADLLLLVIPKTENPNGIIPGKIFEYLATGNNILCIGPESCDVAKIIKACHAGETFDRDNKQSISEYMASELDRFSKNEPSLAHPDEIIRFSRENQAVMIKGVLDLLY